ncbi:MAG: hypothetical protein J5780_06110, partial [Treponema sp.]|nr:hypothetical protein [Treponema sp.]
MKKVIFLLFSMIILTGTICAQDFSDSKNTSHVFASVYFSDSMAIGKISEYNRCSFGHGLVAGYAFSQIPVNLNLRAEFADN